MIWSSRRTSTSIRSRSTICPPFYGTAAIAYIPNGEVVGLSKIARTLEVFAKRFQLQERLTAQVADVFMEELKPQGVMVLIEAEHMCMTMRGVKKPGTKTVTVVTREYLTKMRDSKITFTGCWSADKKMVRINRICAHPRWNESVKKSTHWSGIAYFASMTLRTF